MTDSAGVAFVASAAVGVDLILRNLLEPYEPTPKRGRGVFTSESR